MSVFVCVPVCVPQIHQQALTVQGLNLIENVTCPSLMSGHVGQFWMEVAGRMKALT